jgi:hypothetical protein
MEPRLERVKYFATVLEQRFQRPKGTVGNVGSHQIRTIRNKDLSTKDESMIDEAQQNLT